MELLSPAGNFDKLKAAIAFGADAVYMGGPAFGLRAKAGNFGYDEMEEAFKYLHERGKKGYVTVNVFPVTKELCDIEKYLQKIENLKTDGIIVSDPGIFAIAKKVCPKTPISISTQANTTNLAAVNFWGDIGAKRVILAREIEKNDLEEIVKNANCEIETFIHGAICISMSGRCLISSYMTGRNANNGECTHPCRWKYAVVEESRPNQEYPIEEDDRGTYLYNSKDLCMINRIGELVQMGVKSGKIEGRMKSVMYVSIITGVYRKAIDLAMSNNGDYKADPYWVELLERVSNRGYIEGFYSGSYNAESENRQCGGYTRGADFLGVAVGRKGGKIHISCRAKFATGENMYLVTPDMKKINVKPEIILDEGDNVVEATRPNYLYKLNVEEDVEENSLLLRFKENETR